MFPSHIVAVTWSFRISSFGAFADCSGCTAGYYSRWLKLEVGKLFHRIKAKLLMMKGRVYKVNLA